MNNPENTRWFMTKNLITPGRNQTHFFSVSFEYPLNLPSSPVSAQKYPGDSDLSEIGRSLASSALRLPMMSPWENPNGNCSTG